MFKFLLLLSFSFSLANSSANSFTNSFGNSQFFLEQRKGANFFNNIETEERIIDAKEFGIEFIRLSPNKWMCGSAKKQGDFLIGNTENPIVKPSKEDVTCLKDILDKAQKHNVKVILTMISLPYGRWRQHNKGIQERRVFESFEKQDFAIQFWVNLLKEIGPHPALAGINLLNEASPEKIGLKFKDWYTNDYAKWYKAVEGTPQDINLFNKKAVAQIRTVNKNIPIIIEGGFYATPYAFKILKPIDDENILYSAHTYEPFAYTNKSNKGKYKYNSPVPIGEEGYREIILNKKNIEKLLQPILDFQKKYNISSNKIIISEFGIYRTNPDAALHLKTLIEIFKQNKWHFAFYSFREDAWDGMDYELGTGKLKENYWNSIEKKKMPDYTPYKNNELILILKHAYTNGGSKKQNN